MRLGDQIAWAAGLIEGEGCFYIWTQHQGKRAYRYSRVQVNSTDLDVLERLQRIFGTGSICGPYAKSTEAHPGRKAQWQWQVAGVENFKRVVGLIRPWLCGRRAARVDEIMALVDAGEVR